MLEIQDTPQLVSSLGSTPPPAPTQPTSSRCQRETSQSGYLANPSYHIDAN